ncbi:hypothetical protein [Streptosporangium sp. NPDC002607]
MIGHPVRRQEISPPGARRQMAARDRPSEAVDDILPAQAEMTAGPAPVTATVQEVTAGAARTFRSW